MPRSSSSIRRRALSEFGAEVFYTSRIRSFSFAYSHQCISLGFLRCAYLLTQVDIPACRRSGPRAFSRNATGTPSSNDDDYRHCSVDAVASQSRWKSKPKLGKKRREIEGQAYFDQRQWIIVSRGTFDALDGTCLFRERKQKR
ncbi:uncharacterized protein LOC143183377 [Calliopsis andreniformis]|uniref:uncharacterized protein LOC143183377 n=1 Tax=Calliopsis andreniformis TaxID=337506 RepID=UPI003FCDA7E5